MAKSYGGGIVANALFARQAAMGEVDDFRRDRAKLTAGNALAAGDYDAGAGALYKSGQIDEGYQTQQRGVDEQKRQARITGAQAYAGGDYKAATDAFAGVGDVENVQAVEGAEKKKRVEQLDFTLRATKSLRQILAQRGGGDAMAAFDQLMPTFEQMGTPREQLEQFRQAMAANPQGFLDQVETIVGQEADKLRFEKTGDEVVVLNERTGDLVQRYSPSRYKLGAGDQVVETGQGGSPMAPASAGGSPEIDDIFGALIMQESGGRPGVTGPDTPYGNAQGMTQMLPETARSMAQKLGVAWRPELMTGTSPEAAQYQQTLGRAYFEEGLQKYGGDVEKALMYYHGGPDERIWGPKTRQYAQDVLGRLGSAQTAGPGAPTGGGRVIAQGAPKPNDGWVDRGDYLENAAGDRKPDPAAKPEQQAEKFRQTAQAEIAKAETVLDRIDSAINSAGWTTTGFVGGNISDVKGTPAYDLARDLDTIKANLGFAELNEMRLNSPTGGALGQVTERELAFLQSTLASLDPGQSPQQLKRNLQDVKARYTRIINAARRDLGQPVSTAPKPSASPPPRRNTPQGARSTSGPRRLSVEEASKLKPGTRFIGLDGKERVRQ